MKNIYKEENINIKMARNILGNGLMINVMDMEYFIIMIKAIMKENGKMDKNMDQAL